MHGSNRFIKILISERENSDPLFLYGFSVQTNQPYLPWKFSAAPKKRYGVWTAVLSESESSEFEQALVSGTPVNLNGTKYQFSCFVRRDPVLSNDNGSEQMLEGPTKNFCILDEFWNIDKQTLVQDVMATFSSSGKELYLEMQALLRWIRSECGVNISAKGYRFGNYERFTKDEYSTDFCINTDKESCLKRVTIRKTFDLAADFVVRCAAEHRERWIINEVKLLPVQQQEIVFVSKEPMSRVFIQIWNLESGKLVFSKDIAHIMSTQIGINIGSTTRMVRDPWSEKLHSTAQNRGNMIEEQIETVKPFAVEHDMVIKSPTHDSIDSAMVQGCTIFERFRQTQCRGAFVPNTQKDGEIDSFIKIQEYLNISGLDRVTIADPYFSIDSAAKLLSRIANTSLYIDIITSLGMKNPDTGEVSDACADCEEFLQKNAAMLHKNLQVFNLHRGKDPVFHDRYLIRYHTNGSIDGFLLSNSLNAAGKFFPFVIAPLEQEVCLQVCDYLEQMCSDVYQNTVPKKNRISSKILTVEPLQSPTNAVTSASEKTSVLFPMLVDWVGLHPQCMLARKKFLAEPLDRRTLDENDFPDILEVIEECKSTETKYAALGEAINYTYMSSYEIFFKAFRSVDGMAGTFLTEIVDFATEKESQQNHLGKGTYSEEYKLWALLSGRATPSKQGIDLLLSDFGHVWYSQYYFLNGIYRLLFHLDANVFISLMLKTSSPLMLSLLTERMAVGSWNDTLYQALLNSPLEWLKALAAHWLFHYYERNKMSNDWLCSLLTALPVSNRILQEVCLLSQLTFCIRTSRCNMVSEKSEMLLNNLIEISSKDMENAPKKLIENALEWLFDCKDYSNCYLHMKLSSHIKCKSVQNMILSRAAVIAENYLVNATCLSDAAKQIIPLYVQIAEILYGTDVESKVFSHVLQWDAFRFATEPQRWSYDHSNWYKAYQRALWQMELLLELHKQFPTLGKAKEWIDAWQQRLSAVIRNAPP